MKENKKENLKEMKTVYLLGAGASADSDFKLPCLGDFFKESFEKEKYPYLYNFIKNYFPFTSLENLNLEEVITFLELSIDKFGRFGNEIEPSLYNARREFGQFVYDRLNYKPIDGRKWCSKHKIFLEKLSLDDSIITLNYDLVIEHTAYEIQLAWKPDHPKILERMYDLLESTTRLAGGDRPTMYDQYKPMGQLLKLHGSIDWFYCPREMCPHHQAFYPNWIHEKKVLTSPGDLCKACGTPLAPVIIPPTMSKSFVEFPKLGFLWSLAFRKLRDTDRVIIIGLSFTESDYYLRWLIKSSLLSRGKAQPKVLIVDKNNEICHKFENLTGIAIPAENYFGSIDDFNQSYGEGFANDRKG